MRSNRATDVHHAVQGGPAQGIAAKSAQRWRHPYHAECHPSPDLGHHGRVRTIASSKQDTLGVCCDLASQAAASIHLHHNVDALTDGLPSIGLPELHSSDQPSLPAAIRATLSASKAKEAARAYLHGKATGPCKVMVRLVKALSPIQAREHHQPARRRAQAFDGSTRAVWPCFHLHLIHSWPDGCVLPSIL